MTLICPIIPQKPAAKISLLVGNILHLYKKVTFIFKLLSSTNLNQHTFTIILLHPRGYDHILLST